MNRQEIRNKAKRRREREVAKKKLVITVFCSIILIVVGCIIGGNHLASANVNAKTINAEQEMYKSITIKSGDTLWSIAKEYCPNYVDKQEYVKILMNVNNLSTDVIQQGEHLVVVYYE